MLKSQSHWVLSPPTPTPPTLASIYSVHQRIGPQRVGQRMSWPFVLYQLLTTPTSVLWQAQFSFLPGQVVVGRTQPWGRPLGCNASSAALASGTILNLSLPHSPDL